MPDQLKKLLEAAILAPSSHNTQPWMFNVSGTRISVFADKTRALPANDPDGRELAISCGAALFNLRAAAAHAGIDAKAEILPEPDHGELLAAVDLHRGPQVPERIAELYVVIPKRRTYRKPFAQRPVPESVLADLAEAAEQEGAWLRVLSDERERREAALLVTLGDAVQWADPAWRRELADWMHSRRHGDGLIVPGLIAPIVRAVVRSFDMGKGVGAKDGRLAAASPVLAVLGTHADSRKAWVEAGQALQRLLLSACGAGLQASFLNQPIQIAALRPQLQHAIAVSGFPQILLRLGYPSEDLPAVPRRSLDAVVEQ